MNRPTQEDFAHAVRGLLMGSADIVPGVSGGTVALIVGIYERLVTAISHFDARLVKLLLARQWAAAAKYIDLRFLVALGSGILIGIASLATLMHYLLEHQRSYTLAVFFGLILASAILVGRMVRPTKGLGQLVTVLLGFAGAAFAYWLVRQDTLPANESLGYFFLCGMVAICAMILPGISGAFILVILGRYKAVTSIIKDITHFHFVPSDLAKLAVFAVGCAVGLITFAKLLKWLLANFHNETMAVLCGFMVGSLWKIWPFQHDLTPKVESYSMKKFEHYIPAAWTPEVILCLALGACAFLGVLALERIARRSTQASSHQESSH